MWFFSRDPTSTFRYEVGEEMEGLEDKSVWSLHNGKKKVDGQPVSIFVLDVKTSSSAVIERGKTSHKRMKTLRHPNFLQYIDGLETDNITYAVTEQVTPLQTYLRDSSPNHLAISWGLHQIVKGLSFLHNDCKLKHNNVNMSSVFVSQAGEWKVGGVAYVGPAEGEGSEPPDKGTPSLEKYNPPEMTDIRTKKKTNTWSADMWGLGCLIWEIFNGPLPRTSSLKSLGKIPKSLVANYCELVSANPLSRPNPAKFILSSRDSGGFLDNSFVITNLFLEEIQIKEQNEKNKFLASLSSTIDDFPQVFCRYRILPLLLQAFEFGGAGSAVLTPLLKLGKLLDADEYQKKIVPCVVKMFSSTDRATRVKLLQQMESFVEHLQSPVVNEQIFPNICHGFNDTNPVIREHTVKAMLLLAAKLNDKNLNVELLKHFAKMQTKDDQGGIRTNTTICLGKIACYLNPVTRQKVLSSAFVRAMKDPFPPARTAGVMSMLATQNYYSIRDTALKVLPTLCTLTVDPNKGVRDQTFKAIGVFLQRLQTVSDDPEAVAEMESEVNALAGTPQATSTSWTGWAVTSLTSRFYNRPGTGAKQSAVTTSSDVASTATTGASSTSDQTSTAAPTNPDGRTGHVESSRDSGSDYDDTGGDADGDYDGDGWNDDDKWDDINSFSSATSSQTKPVRAAHKDEAFKQEPQDLSWGGSMEDDLTSRKPNRQASSFRNPQSKTSSQAAKSTAQSQRTGAMKLASGRTTMDSWGSEDAGWDDVQKSKPNRTDIHKTAKSSPKQSGSRSDSLGDGWDDTGDWGAMDVSETQEAVGGDDWGNGDGWGAIEDVTPTSRLQADKSTKPSKPPPPGWDDSLDFTKDSSHTPASSYNWGDQPTAQDEFFRDALAVQKPKSATFHSKKSTTTATTASSTAQPAKMSSSGLNDREGSWGTADDDWGTFSSETSQSKAEEAKIKREKRLEREKEIKEKRAARKATGMGATRLGTKK